jgi:CHAT domain-containing protein
MKARRKPWIPFAYLAVLVCGAGDDQWHVIARARQDSLTPLLPGERLAGRLNGSPIAYRLELKPNQYFGLSIQKGGTGLSLTLLEPDGKLLRSVSCAHDGPLQISELASMPGQYTVRLSSCEQQTEPTSYELNLSFPKTATNVDRLRVAAERLSDDAKLLTAQYRADRRRAAILKYEEALGKWKAIGDRVEESSALTEIAKLYRDLGNSARAVTYTENALIASRSAKEPASEAEALLTLATIQLNRGDTSKAMASCTRVLDLGRSNSNRRAEERALYLLGMVHYETGHYVEATNALEEAKKISHDRGNKLGLARAILYLAAIDFDLQRFDTAREKGQQALSMFESLSDKQGQAMGLTYLGHFHSAMGQKQEAMNLYQEARLLVTDSGDFFTETSLLNGIARTHLDLGDTKAALQFFSLALEKTRVLGDRIGIAYALRSVGHCYFAGGDTRNALTSLSQALSIFRSLSNKNREGYVLQDIGLVLEVVGNKTSAIQHLNQALDISRSIKYRRLEAWTLTTKGHIRETAGDIDGALEYYEEALCLSEAVGDHLGRLTLLYRIAGSLRGAGKLQEAIVRSEIALEAIEEFRASVANTGLRTSYFASVRQQYELFIDVLMRIHQTNGSAALDVRAFETSERSRARTLLDSIAETRLFISEGVDPKQLEREVSLRTSLDTKAERYTQLLSSSATSKATAELSDEIRRLTAEYEELQGQIRVRSPRYASLVQPEPLSLVRIQNELLDNDSLLLEYALGDENSYLFAVTREDFTSFVLPKRSEIEKRLRRLRELMTARLALRGEKPGEFLSRVKRDEAHYPQTAAELSQMLLGPVADRLGRRRLVIVAEGVLQYLPFGGLPTPQSAQTSSFTPLVVEHEIVNLPSASTLAVIRRAPLRGNPDRTLAVFGDPVFEAQDPRVLRPPRASASAAGNPGPPAPRPIATARSGRTPRRPVTQSVGIDLARLPSTRQEAEAILAMVPTDRRLAALGFQATKAAAMNPDLKRYRIVHFATHAILNDDHPDLSSLVLSLVDERGNPENGFLRLRDMYNLKLSAELVVLSACETALGKEVKGEGFMSMVRGFMYSGTPRVLASLWKVDDEATAELMKEFYKHLLENGLSPAAALRQAQITQSQKKSRQSPYYWAGFQLQGEWK